MDHQMIRVVEALCQDVGTPRAQCVYMLCKYGEWTQLQELRCRPSDYFTVDSYYRDVIVTDLLRKCNLPTDVDKEGKARETFLLCEQQCARTNVRLARYLHNGPFVDPVEARVSSVIDDIRKEVNFILGALPTSLTPRFSGGATYADGGVKKTTPDKMSNAPQIYEHSTDLLPFWESTLWGRNLVRDRPWFSRPVAVRGNIFFTVPKDGLKHRGCCKEASVNIALQLDVGRIMKTKLLRSIGIDLHHGATYHQELARSASLPGGRSLATIDLSNASDTVSRVAVELLLPELWFELLSSLRAGFTRMKGRWYRLEKFSSMGNGFTFELETTIFVAIARTVVSREGGDPDAVSCFGDDLIVPADNYLAVIAALAFFGFTPNMNKTYSCGPFRESCGGDFFNGVPVRAHFIEELPNEPQQWISLANGIRRLGHRDSSHTVTPDLLRRSWLRCLDPIPTHIRRLRGPVHLGDIVIHDEPEYWSHVESPEVTWSDGFIRAYCPIPSVIPWNHWLPAVVLACATLGYPSAGYTPRGGVSGYKITVVQARLKSTWVPTSRE